MKPFAIYFPQFYAIPTNDMTWGQGFTDWVLVANANLRDDWDRRAPLRGYYDGSSSEIHKQQIAEAVEAGLGGVGVYHYWFYTHQELSAFEHTMLHAKGNEKLAPWFLIWASEGWSKRWIGNSKTIIQLSHTPTNTDIELHCDHLATCFSSNSYHKWRGKPLFAWYNLSHFSRPAELIATYRRCMNNRGFDIAIAHFVKNPFDLQYSSLVDATYLFEPRLFFGTMKAGRGGTGKFLLEKFNAICGENATNKLLLIIDRLQAKGTTYTASDFLNYLKSSERAAFLEHVKSPYQEVISPGWNNTPRYGERFTALESLPPNIFASLVSDAVGDNDLPLLINAWNEWSEGAAIEPCAYLGRRYLDSLQQL